MPAEALTTDASGRPMTSPKTSKPPRLMTELDADALQLFETFVEAFCDPKQFSA